VAKILNIQFNRLVNNSHVATFSSIQTGGPIWLTPPNNPPSGWQEMDGYQEEFGIDASRATRLFVGPWITRYDFVQWALGWTFSIPSATNPGQGQLVRLLPAQHPEFPWLFAMHVKLVKGLGAWTNNPYVGAQDECGNVATDPVTGYAVNPIPMICYFDEATGLDTHSCLYAVDYEAVDYEIRDTSYLPNGEMSRWVTKSFTFSSKALSVPSNRLQFADGSGPIPEPGIQILGSQEWTYLWRQVPDVPWSAIQNSVGGVNNAPFDGDPGWPSFPTGTMLCLSPETIRHRGPTGRIVWDVAYKFLYFDPNPGGPSGHNYFPKISGSTLTWVLGTMDGTTTGQTLYPSVDLTKLFVPPAPQNYQTPTAPTSGCP